MALLITNVFMHGLYSTYPDTSTSPNTSEWKKVLVSTFDSHNSMQLRLPLQQWTACANNAKRRDNSEKRSKKQTGLNETKKDIRPLMVYVERSLLYYGKSVGATHNTWIVFCFFISIVSFIRLALFPLACIGTFVFFCTALSFCSSVLLLNWWKTSSFYNRFFMIFYNAAHTLLLLSCACIGFCQNHLNTYTTYTQNRCVVFV